MRQRSKLELLAAYRTYTAVKKDVELSEDRQVANNVSYWRTCVEVVYILWKVEKLSRPVIATVLQYINDNILSMDDTRREEIRQLVLLKTKGAFDIVNENKKHRKCRTEMDEVYYSQLYYNAQMANDVLMLSCEWLINNKNYGEWRVDRVLVNTYYMDKNSSHSVLAEFRDEIFYFLNIWLSLSESDKAQAKEYIEANKKEFEFIDMQ